MQRQLILRQTAPPAKSPAGSLASAATLHPPPDLSGFSQPSTRGELSASADPHDLALALLCAVEGGLLLAKTTHSSRPLELSLDMAIDHVARHITARTSAPTARVRQ